VAVCAAVSPYRATRDTIRAMTGSEHFIEIFVDTPLDVCEARDAKGMYAAARRGAIKNFTGIDDPYEAPASPELTLETTQATPEENARKVIEVLRGRGFVR
jgi:sulfate adenylyltransferase